MQNKNVFEKQSKSSYKTDIYDNIDYQSTYELDFLEKYYDNIRIEKINPIKYFLNENEHYYHPDFYLPDYNLIIEIKSSYTYDYDLNKNLAKKEYSIKYGYEFLFIIDKDYKDFESYISSNPTGL
jgi:predicted nuclease of restriction endonuclease-like RecB superfamily